MLAPAKLLLFYNLLLYPADPAPPPFFFQRKEKKKPCYSWYRAKTLCQAPKQKWRLDSVPTLSAQINLTRADIPAGLADALASPRGGCAFRPSAPRTPNSFPGPPRPTSGVPRARQHALSRRPGTSGGAGCKERPSTTDSFGPPLRSGGWGRAEALTLPLGRGPPGLSEAAPPPPPAHRPSGERGCCGQRADGRAGADTRPPAPQDTEPCARDEPRLSWKKKKRSLRSFNREIFRFQQPQVTGFFLS